MALAIGLLPTRAFALDITVTTDSTEKLAYFNMWGQIEAGDDRKFMELALKYVRGGYLIFKVNIFSAGGDVAAAMSIGDQIRMLQARTHSPVKFSNTPAGQIDCWFDGNTSDGAAHPHPIYRYNTQNRSGSSWCTCASACFLIWASGITREGNYVGIHRPYYSADYFKGLSPAEARVRYDELRVHYKKYLEKLDVPVSVIDRLFATDSKSVYFLAKSELNLLQSTPYLEELTQAKCPPDRTKREYFRDGRWKSTTYDPIRINCYRTILKEVMSSGVKDYLARYGP